MRPYAERLIRLHHEPVSIRLLKLMRRVGREALNLAGFQKMGLNLAGFAKMGLMVAAGLGESDSEELQVANGTRSRRLWQSPPHASLQQ